MRVAYEWLTLNTTSSKSIILRNRFIGYLGFDVGRLIRTGFYGEGTV